jgi:cytidylate kinase
MKIKKTEQGGGEMPRELSVIVDEQIRRWRFEQGERAGRPERALHQHADVIAISNAIGSAGAVIAQVAADLLRIPVYDREILAHIAETAHVHVETVETLDKRAVSRLDDYLTALFREHSLDQNDYLKLLTRTVGALWEHGPCVMVGHGAVHIIPRRHALAVRIIASEPDRVRRLMELHQLSEAEARRMVERTDAERRSFHRRYFRRDVDDCRSYDLVINSSRLTYEHSAALVVEAYRHKFHLAKS